MSWLQKLKQGLSKSSQKVSESLKSLSSLSSLIGASKLDASSLEEVEDALIGADLGTASAAYGPVTTTSPTPTAPPTPVPMLPLGGLLGVGLLVAGLGGRRLRQAWRR